jgi:hypothetical protein
MNRGPCGAKPAAPSRGAVARRALAALVALALGFAAPAAVASAHGAAAAEAPKAKEKTVCRLIDESAAAHGLPVGFLTRLIWKESRFEPGAVSPKGAQGIAQFMPGTAKLRGLADPFDPRKAIPAAARYLSELSASFGNLGLAAAAYNSGEDRTSAWLADGGGLPWETRDYVLSITGRTVEDWKALLSRDEAAAQAAPAETTCAAVAAIVSKPGAGTRSATWAPWGVQVAGNFSRARALASYKRLQRRHPALLADRAPLVLRSVNRSRGPKPFTEIRLAEQTRAAAEKLCGKLRKAGAACIVLRN